jgi:hypothetical protein
MLIQETLKQIDALLGKTVTVRGHVIVTGDGRAFLASCPEAFERQECLSIGDSGRIVVHLLQALPAFVGGPFLYDEECIVTGTIERCDDSIELRNLRSCRVRRDALETEVPADESSATG